VSVMVGEEVGVGGGGIGVEVGTAVPPKSISLKTVRALSEFRGIAGRLTNGAMGWKFRLIWTRTRSAPPTMASGEEGGQVSKAAVPGP
jgi:hypothetical protein